METGAVAVRKGPPPAASAAEPTVVGRGLLSALSVAVTGDEYAAQRHDGGLFQLLDEALGAGSGIDDAPVVAASLACCKMAVRGLISSLTANAASSGPMVNMSPMCTTARSTSFNACRLHYAAQQSKAPWE